MAIIILTTPGTIKTKSETLNQRDNVSNIFSTNLDNQLSHSLPILVVSNHRNIINPGISLTDRQINLANEQRIREEQEKAKIQNQSTNSSREEGLQICKESWSEEDCGYLDFIFQHESGWIVGRPNSEGCAGLGQACPASKLGTSLGNLEAEIRYFMNYCLERYDNSPKEAYEHWLVHKSW